MRIAPRPAQQLPGVRPASTVRGPGIAMVLLLVAASARGEIALPAIYSDGMVVPGHRPVEVRGTATPDRRVTVRFAGREASTSSGPNGQWRLRIEPPDYGGPYTLQVLGENTVKIRDVLVGVVCLFSGQSNMGMSVRGTKRAEQAVDAAPVKRLRAFASKPGERQWRRSTAEHVPNFSAVAYYTGRSLRKHLDVPVGIVVAARGGTMIASWTSRAAYEKAPQLRRQVVDAWDRTWQRLPKVVGEKAWDKLLEKHDGDAQAARRQLLDKSTEPGANFRASLKPIRGYSFTGAVWYQGESNAWGFPIAARYQRELELLIRDWRDWFRKDLPVLVVQLPHHQNPKTDRPLPASPWSWVMEAQWQVQHTFDAVHTAVTADLGGEGIHPKNKQPVGDRLARLARRHWLGRDVTAHGPRPGDVTFRDGRAIVRLHDAEGLHANNGEPIGLTIAGDGRRFVWADAEIDGERLILRSDRVEQPKAMRYAWSGEAVFNLYNRADLPAVPFRTDDWHWDPPARSRRSAVAAVADEPINVDGLAKESAWSRAEATGGFKHRNTYAAAANETAVRFAWDEDRLYALIDAHQPEEPTADAAADSRDAEAVWRDDNVQLLIDADRDRRTYRRFVVNPAGARADARAFNDTADTPRALVPSLLDYQRGLDLGWDGPWRAAAERTDRGWRAEIAIPWRALGRDGPPERGGQLGLQVTRKRAATAAHLEWATTEGDRNTGAMLPPHMAGGKVMYHGVSGFGALRTE